MTSNEKFMYANAIEINEKQARICKHRYKKTEEFKKFCENLGGDANPYVQLFKRADARLLFWRLALIFRIRRALGLPYPTFWWMTESEYINAQVDSLVAYDEFLEDMGETV